MNWPGDIYPRSDSTTGLKTDYQRAATMDGSNLTRTVKTQSLP